MKAAKCSFLDTWDVSLKIPALFLLMISMACVKETVLLPLLPGIALLLAAVSGLPLKLFLSVLKAPVVFALAMGVFLTVFSGEDIADRAGLVPIRTSVAIASLGILLRVISIVSVGTVMVHTTAISKVSYGLRRIRIPGMLVDMGILTGRYIIVIGEDYGRMRTARALRGYSPDGNIRRFLQVTVPATGTLLIKAFQRSETVFSAMKLRGYGGRHTAAARGYSSKDLILFLGAVALSIILVWLELTHGF